MTHPTIKAIRSTITRNLDNALVEARKCIDGADQTTSGDRASQEEFNKLKQHLLKLIREANVAMGMATILTGLRKSEDLMTDELSAAMDDLVLCKKCGCAMGKAVPHDA